MPDCLSGMGSLQAVWQDIKSGANQALSDASAAVGSYLAERGEELEQWASNPVAMALSFAPGAIGEVGAGEAIGTNFVVTSKGAAIRIPEEQPGRFRPMPQECSILVALAVAVSTPT